MQYLKPKKLTREEKDKRAVEKFYALKDRARKKSTKRKYEKYYGISNREKQAKDKETSLAVRERDSWVCQDCDCDFRSRPWQLHAHHVLGRIQKWLRWNIRYMISLCWECHSPRAHTKKARKKYLEKLEEIYKKGETNGG